MIGSYLKDKVKIISREPSDWGEETLHETTVKARFEFRNRMVRDDSGEEVVSTATVYFCHTTTVTTKDHVKYEDREYPILSIERIKSFSKVYMLKVSLG